MILVIVRGLPGSGKTTLAKSLGYKHLEPDSYFICPDGEYRFSQNYAGYAHQWCREELERNLKKGHSVTVSHTFIKNWEMREYCDVAKRNGAEVQIIEVHGPWKDAHGVPQETLERMKMLWEPLDKEVLKGWEW